MPATYAFDNRVTEREFWTEVLRHLIALVRAVERYKLGDGKGKP